MVVFHTQARHPIRSTYWLLIFVGLLALTIYSLVILIQDIHEYPVLTTTAMLQNSSVIFPAVTVCNLNRINCQNLLTTLEGIESDVAAAANGSYTGSRTAAELRADLSKLKELMILTKCDVQLCQLARKVLPWTRYVPDNDPVLLASLTRLPCLEKSPSVASRAQFVEISCYYLHTMKIDVTLSGMLKKNKGPSET